MTFPAFSVFLMGLVVLVGWVLYKLLRVLGRGLGHLFRGLGFVLGRSGGLVKNILIDALHAVGALATGVAILPLAVANLAIGRLRSAAYYGRAIEDELISTGLGLYRVALGHPLRFLGAGVMLDGFERRIPDLVDRAPRGKGRRKKDSFEGYEVYGRLPQGGSGAQLYLARPKPEKVAKLTRSGTNVPGDVVIKSFAVEQGSTLPQIVRESRALEAARRMGLVLDHDLGEGHFHYVMPYVRGEELNAVVHRLHTHAGPEGLDDISLGKAFGYVSDLLYTLERFHRGGLWHKDIKPNNLIVASDGRAHLVDFGLLTPLASAMTLTTHGTEYYRDPEMVRLALRGVKVHEVDGAKFDIYSAGALLYSMIENSFPAHGSLSKINRRCPEALQWIVRRAMSDMRTRYGSAREMRADIACLQANRDPWSVRPADLPSFRLSESGVDPTTGTQPFLQDGPELEPIPMPAAPGDTPSYFPVEEPRPPAVRRRRRRRALVAAAAAGVVSLGVIAAVEELDSNSHAHWATASRQGRAPDRFERFEERDRDVLRTADMLSRALGENDTGSQEERSDWMRHVNSVLPQLDRRPPPPSGPKQGIEGGRVLVLEDTGESLDPRAAQDLHDELTRGGFEVLDRFTRTLASEADVDLFARARHAVGLSGPNDALATHDLQGFLNRSEQLDAILWVVPGTGKDDYSYRILVREPLSAALPASAAVAEAP